MCLGWGKDLGVEGEDNAIARNFSARLCSVGRGSFWSGEVVDIKLPDGTQQAKALGVE